MESLVFSIRSSTEKSCWLMFFSAILLQFGQATDTIVSTQDVSVGQTITSAGRTFELGFFSPANSSRTYVGIWYRDIPHTIVWVANNEKPLSASDRSARLKIGTDGNLRILDGKQGVVWSTNISSQLNNSIAMLSDTGNFILKDNISGWNAWESFRYPSDVLLTSMQLGLNTKTGQKQFLNSWRSTSDPSTGNFTAGLLPVAPVECLVWNGASIHWRSGPWNGIRFVGVPYQGPSYLNDWSLQQNNQSGTLYLGVNQYDNPYIRITRLTPDGSLKTMQWTGKDWNVTWDWESSQNPCDVYGACGSFGVCSAKGPPVCHCLKGYIPKSPVDWSKGNWTDGCVRQTEFLCSKNASSNPNAKFQKDDFLKLSRMKLPYKYELLSSEEDPRGCQDWCLHNCSCTAYSYVTGIGCLVWTGHLIDLQLFPYSGQDLFIRLGHLDQAKNNKTVVIISVTIALVIIAISLFTYIICRSRLKNEGGSRSMPVTHIFWKDSIKNSSDMSNTVWRNGLKQVEAEELPTLDLKIILEATNGFSERNKIGEGGFGAVFKGKLQDGQEIAVKRLSSCSRQGMDEFRNEILLISKLQHKNLVKILGCSVKGEEKLLLYEFLPNRSLDTFLFDDARKKRLDWGTRFSIIKGIARGMSYLHQDSRLRVIHRDLKASNILLDDDMKPKISDFGLARIFETTQASANTVRVAGTFGYMSPEYAMRGIISEKSDVFSFGVLMLEIISGKKSSSLLFGYHDISLVDYAWKLWIEGRGLDMVDESLVKSYSDIEVWRCMHIALLCVQDLADDRPTMPTVVLMLGSETPLPEPKQPTYVPQTPSSCAPSHPSDNGSCFLNEITISQIEGR